MSKPILIDIMENGKFVCQMKYYKRGFPQIVDGIMVEKHDFKDIEEWVETQRPSLKSRKYTIEFSIQKV